MDRWVAPGTEHGAVAPVRVDPTGERGPTKRQAASSSWRRSSRGLYVPADVPLTTTQRVVEAGVLVPVYSALTGWAALHWHGGRWFTGTSHDDSLLDVPIAAPRGRIRPQAGIRITGERFDPHEAVNVDGIWVASAVMATCFASRYASSLADAAVALSMAAFDDLVSLDEAGEYADARASYTGIPQGRDALPHADENAWSPQEVRMLRAWEAAGFPRPLTNRPVFDHRGSHVGTPDLIDVRAGVIGQYDGSLHVIGDDVVRDETFARHGLETVVARAGDLRTHRWEAQLRAAYARGERRPASDRTWTTELPAWWVPTFTVEQRRALDHDQRDRWLRYRAA